MYLKIEAGLLALIMGTREEVAREIVLGRPSQESPKEQRAALGLSSNASKKRVLAAMCERLGLNANAGLEAVGLANYALLARQLEIDPDSTRPDIIRADLRRLATLFGIDGHPATFGISITTAAYASCKDQLDLPRSANPEDVQSAGTRAGWYRAGRVLAMR